MFSGLANSLVQGNLQGKVSTSSPKNDDFCPKSANFWPEAGNGSGNPGNFALSERFASRLASPSDKEHEREQGSSREFQKSQWGTAFVTHPAEALLPFPRFYPILVPSRIGGGNMPEICEFAREVVEGGARIVQLREKQSSSKEILRLARELRRVLPNKARLIINDRSDLAVAASADGVHLGQDDLPPDAARKIIGQARMLGVSTHNPQQVEIAHRTSADYVAIGPVFATISKDNPDPLIGFGGVRQGRSLTNKPLVAIGGITLDNCRSVIESGADSVAVIGAILDDPRKTTAQFLLKMR